MKKITISKYDMQIEEEFIYVMMLNEDVSLFLGRHPFPFSVLDKLHQDPFKNGLKIAQIGIILSHLPFKLGEINFKTYSNGIWKFITTLEIGENTEYKFSISVDEDIFMAQLEKDNAVLTVRFEWPILDGLRVRSRMICSGGAKSYNFMDASIDIFDNVIKALEELNVPFDVVEFKNS